MSAFILKLLDEAIVPAVIVFCLKLGGLILAADYWGVGFSLSAGSLTFNDLDGLVLANNVSNLLVLAAIFLGGSLVLTRLYFFHESHLHPFWLAKLLDSDLEFAVSTSFNLFHQALVWLSLGFFVVGSFFIQSLFGLTSFWIFFSGFLVLLGLGFLTLLDFEREAKIEAEDKPSLWVSQF